VLDKHLKTATQKWKDVATELNTLKELKAEEKQKLKTVSTELQTAKEKVETIKGALDARRSDIITTVNKLDHIEEDIDRIKASLTKEQDRNNPYDKMISSNESKIKLLKHNKRYLLEEKEEIEHLTGAYETWKRGFKEIRLMVVDESIKELEIQINNNLQLLGLEDWSIELDIESETQKGKTIREFTVLVSSPFGGGKVPLEVWSGGEGQRLRLAGTLGLMDFIHNRRNSDWNIEAFDEPSTWLSDKGIQQLLDVLYFRAKKLKKTILLADHRDFNTFGKFSGTLSLIKDKRGTRINTMEE
jgi:DNA repair exonuclease SbcCD ATPase subunit